MRELQDNEIQLIETVAEHLVNDLPKIVGLLSIIVADYPSVTNELIKYLELMKYLDSLLP